MYRAETHIQIQKVILDGNITSTLVCTDNRQIIPILVVLEKLFGEFGA